MDELRIRSDGSLAPPLFKRAWDEYVAPFSDKQTPGFADREEDDEELMGFGGE